MYALGSNNNSTRDTNIIPTHRYILLYYIQGYNNISGETDWLSANEFIYYKIVWVPVIRYYHHHHYCRIDDYYFRMTYVPVE